MTRSTFREPITEMTALGGMFFLGRGVVEEELERGGHVGCKVRGYGEGEGGARPGWSSVADADRVG